MLETIVKETSQQEITEYQSKALLLELAGLISRDVRFTCNEPRWKRKRGQSYWVICRECSSCRIAQILKQLKLITNEEELVAVA